ncbi:MAG: hypothetical protein EG823_07820 [Actinobacteria bacterium]|nr:hypothetical protein [Actinomycetota bacterium]
MRVLPDERPAPLMERSPESAAAELRLFGEELSGRAAAQVGGHFTDVREANELIERSPEAFLLGVLFTQGIPAERAWAGPYLLSQRLGHLDLERLALEREAVAEAVAFPPALHRFVHTLPGWISAAAARLLAEYGGSAAAIWPAGAHTLDVTERLLAFDGIGEKKAVMAVEILRRHFGVPLEGAECGSVAYDVHVRRVFLRTGLADADTPEAIATAARAACPEVPGVLDLAAWLVGRDWCRPKEPRCDECRLSAACPRLTARTVDGVGVRRR